MPAVVAGAPQALAPALPLAAEDEEGEDAKSSFGVDVLGELVEQQTAQSTQLATRVGQVGVRDQASGCRWWIVSLACRRGGNSTER